MQTRLDRCPRWLAFLLPCGALLAMILVGCSRTSKPTLRLATTTTTQDSGLLEKLIKPFETQQHVQINVIVVGTGKALKLGEAGDVDVLLVHDRKAEDAFMVAGHGIRHELVMQNTFELLGPPDDPANVRGLSAADALQKIAASKFPFVSRGDDSGTHKREQRLWQQGGGRSTWASYQESGQGMGTTLMIANQLSAYVLTDRATFLNFQDKIVLSPLVKQSPELLNPYAILIVNPDMHPDVRSDLANAFVDYVTSPTGQQIIADYRLAGETLFSPLQPTTE